MAVNIIMKQLHDIEKAYIIIMNYNKQSHMCTFNDNYIHALKSTNRHKPTPVGYHIRHYEANTS